MAARRLIIVMLVLLGISTAIAFIVPEPKTDDPQEATTGTTGSTGASGTTGASDPGPPPAASDVVEVTVNADEGVSPVAAKPGDRVVLTVQPAAPTYVEIEALGLIAFATDFAPAVFDFMMPSDPESFEVTQSGNDRLLVSVSSSAHNLEAQEREDTKNQSEPQSAE
ncbi:MAG: hypothetical protein WBP55_04465 [Solirubrobacterales bacterium]